MTPRCGWQETGLNSLMDPFTFSRFSAPRSAPVHEASPPPSYRRLCLITRWAQPDEDVYENHHSHKRRISPPEQDVGGCVGLGLRQKLLPRQISSRKGTVFSAEHQRWRSHPGREDQKKDLKSLYALEWPLANCRPKPAYPWQRARWDCSHPLTLLSQCRVLRAGAGDTGRLICPSQ